MLEVREIAGQATWIQGPQYKEACDKQNLEMAQKSPKLNPYGTVIVFEFVFSQPELH